MEQMEVQTDLPQAKLEPTEMLVDVTSKEEEKVEEDEDVVSSLLVLVSPIALHPVVWSLALDPSTPMCCLQLGLLREVNAPVSVEEALVMSGLGVLVREWVELEELI